MARKKFTTPTVEVLQEVKAYHDAKTSSPLNALKERWRNLRSDHVELCAEQREVKAKMDVEADKLTAQREALLAQGIDPALL